MQTRDCFDNRITYLPALPDEIFIESVMGCNLRCGMCPVPKHSETMNGREFSVMGIDTFQKIIQQISDKPRKIFLSILGEPLLNKSLLDFVLLAKKDNHFVTFATNGTLMNGELAEKLLLAGLDQIYFSIDGTKKETYESIRVGANYDDVVKNVSDFYQIRNKINSKCFVIINCVVSDLTKNEVSELSKTYGHISDQIQTHPLTNFSTNYEVPKEFGATYTYQFKDKKRYPCFTLWSSLYISAEGNVVYCCTDNQNCPGRLNVNTLPLIEIWNTSVKKERDRHILNKIDREPCKSCAHWKPQPFPLPKYHPKRYGRKFLKRLGEYLPGLKSFYRKQRNLFRIYRSGL